MKKIVVGIFAVIMMVGITSCELDDDSYSLNKYWLDFGIFEKQDNNSDYSITIDDGDKLFPVSTQVPLGNFNDSSRVLVNFTILSDKLIDENGPDEYYVKINSMRKILMKGIWDITPETEDSIGHDPIIVKDVWVSNNLLNVEIKYWGNYKTHYINLVKTPGIIPEPGEPYELELRHNEKNDDRSIPFVSYVSFDLSSLEIPEADSILFKVEATDYDGDLYTYDGVYHYSDN